MKTYDTEKIEKKLATMQRSEVEVYLKSLIYETEKRLIEVQSNSFDHLKDRTQNDYNKYLTALEDKQMIYWYDDKVEVNGKNLNDTIGQKHNIENHKLLRRRLKIENEIKRLQDRKKLFKNLFENFEPKSESEKVFIFTDYLKSNDNNAIIEKIKGLPRSTPKDIFIILKSLIDNGFLLFSKNEDMYNAYYNEFGYHKAYNSLKRALNTYDWGKVAKKHLQKIENMQEYLSI
jgi:hypothetical protein